MSKPYLHEIKSNLLYTIKILEIRNNIIGIKFYRWDSNSLIGVWNAPTFFQNQKYC